MALLEVLAEDFAAIGYDLSATVLIASDYGVPQTRKRAFLVCVPAGQPYSFPFLLRSTSVTVGDAIGDMPDAVLPEEALLLPNHIDVTPERDRYRISFVPEGQWLSKVADVPASVVCKLKAKDSTKFRRLDRAKPSLTLRCGEALYHPTENRHITHREAARLPG